MKRGWEAGRRSLRARFGLSAPLPMLHRAFLRNVFSHVPSTRVCEGHHMQGHLCLGDRQGSRPCRAARVPDLLRLRHSLLQDQNQLSLEWIVKEIRRRTRVAELPGWRVLPQPWRPRLASTSRPHDYGTSPERRGPQNAT
jgi:hypothetical protein